MANAKISDVIKSLVKIMKEHGDLKLVASSDDEGNSYHYFDVKLPYDLNSEMIILYPGALADDDMFWDEEEEE